MRAACGGHDTHVWAVATLSTQALAGQPATLAFLLQRCYRHPSAPDWTPLPLPTNAEGAGALQMAF